MEKCIFSLAFCEVPVHVVSRSVLMPIFKLKISGSLEIEIFFNVFIWEKCPM